MSYQISLHPGDHRFAADADDTLLEAALKAGLLLPHGCRDGACGACKGKLIDGEIDHGAVTANALPDAERAAGYALFCCARPRSDLTLQARTVSRVNDIPVRKMPGRVQKLRRAAPDVMVIELKLPSSEAFRFRAGQYIDVILADGQRRSFSIANAPTGASHLELHVRHIAGGRFTGQVFDTMKEKDILRFEGPLGGFGLREESTRPALLIAGGTGFAPIKAIVEHVIAGGLSRSMSLYWGARTRSGLYMDELARSWQATMPGFRYVPVLSEAPPDDNWNGRVGLVHQAVLEDHADLSGHEVYACGAPAMVEAARSSFAASRGLVDEQFFADAFTFASPAN